MEKVFLDSLFPLLFYPFIYILTSVHDIILHYILQLHYPPIFISMIEHEAYNGLLWNGGLSPEFIALSVSGRS